MNDRERRARLAGGIAGHALLRIASGTSGVLIGLALALRGGPGGAAFVGLLGGVAFALELVASIPLGLTSDLLRPRWQMAAGGLLGACAAVIFALADAPALLIFARMLEGVAAAAIVPALLAYLTATTAGRAALRIRTMSFFELTLLAGLALGGLTAARLFHALHGRAFFVVALFYAACSSVLAISVREAPHAREASALALLRSVARLPGLRALAPVWLCVNAIVGLWLGPMLPFLLTRRTTSTQYLPGLFAAEPSRVGVLLFVYALVFGAGIAVWSCVLPHMRLPIAMRIALAAILPASACLALLNHSTNAPSAVRWALGGTMVVLIMIESGFTPAALAWLAQTLPAAAGRGTAMGAYSVLLSLGAIGGSLLAGVLGAFAAFDGLLAGTAAVAAVALVLLRFVPSTDKLVAERTA